MAAYGVPYPLSFSEGYKIAATIDCDASPRVCSRYYDIVSSSLLFPPPLIYVSSFHFSQVAYNLGARLHTSSWGAASSTPNFNAFTTDRYSYYNQDFLTLFAAGNEGSGLSKYSIHRSQGCLRTEALIVLAEGVFLMLPVDHPFSPCLRP